MIFDKAMILKLGKYFHLQSGWNWKGLNGWETTIIGLRPIAIYHRWLTFITYSYLFPPLSHLNPECLLKCFCGEQETPKNITRGKLEGCSETGNQQKASPLCACISFFAIQPVFNKMYSRIGTDFSFLWWACAEFPLLLVAQNELHIPSLKTLSVLLHSCEGLMSIAFIHMTLAKTVESTSIIIMRLQCCGEICLPFAGIWLQRCNLFLIIGCGDQNRLIKSTGPKHYG